MGSIDRTDWHYGGDFPEGVPNENGATHIGMFLAWIINNDMIGEMHLEEAADDLMKVKNSEMTGRTFFINNCDEKFWDDDLNEEGVKFTNSYYTEKYLQDYSATFENDCKTIYHVEDTWENYDRISKVIDTNYKFYKNNGLRI